jgi:hypothetical protein
MSDISNEYQNSLDKTKLVYDYYGRGDNSTALSYGILMTPSALNDYTPVTITDTLGKVVLDRRYAAAAKYAGIPQEGVGGLPSDVVRQRFLEGLFGNGIITQVQKEQFQAVPYSQLAGVGGAGSLTVYTDAVNKEGLLKALKSGGQAKISSDDFDTFDIKKNNENYGKSITLFDLLSRDAQYTLYAEGKGTWDMGFGEYQSRAESLAKEKAEADVATLQGQLPSFIELLENEFAKVLSIPNDIKTSNALSFATDQLMKMLSEQQNIVLSNNKDEFAAIWDDTSGIMLNRAKDKYNNDNPKNVLGIVSVSAADHASALGLAPRAFGGWATGINLNNLAEAYLTLYAQFMEGELASSNPTYSAQVGSTMGQRENWVTSDPMYLYNVYVGQKFSAETAKMAAFYDTILNQLCTKGWTEDVKIVDNKHLEETLTNGKTFISRLNDDGYYYQGNYATDTYIKVITDDSFIAKAEAKYNSEKNKLNQKEQTLDMKMKNLDTEISALTTEYDTIKSTISKNIEKTFKRYSA